MLKLFRRYLTWVQNSVFEGDLTESQFLELQVKASKIMEKEADSIIFYRLRDERYTERLTLGTEQGERSRML